MDNLVTIPAQTQQVIPAASAIQATPDIQDSHEHEEQDVQPGLFMQFKLSIGAPDDPLEQEADSMAERVMRMPVHDHLQRKCADCMEEDEPVVQRKPMPSFIQRTCAHCKEEEEVMQRKPLSAFIQRKVSGTNNVAGEGISREIQSSRGSGFSMDDSTRSFMENRFGSDFGAVNIHTDSSSIQMNRDLNAKAFTVGRDVYFNEGQYQPQTDTGKFLLAHELTHTIQQGGGIDRTIQRTVDRVNINCADSQIYFEHDGETTSYELDHCDVSDGTYDASVRVSPARVDFDLGTVPQGTAFDFHYIIRPGQANPNTLFRGQQRVNITCTHMPGLSGNDGDIQFSVKRLTIEEFNELTGANPDLFPERVMVPVSNNRGSAGNVIPNASYAGPSGFGASYFSPGPMSMIPSNSTGILWSQGHMSVFANPESSFLPTFRGYRGNLINYIGESLPIIGRNFTIRLHEGVPGSFANDIWAPFMPGEKTYIYVPSDAQISADFAARLRATQYGGNYTYSPAREVPDPILGRVGETEFSIWGELKARGQAPFCTNNCTTVPAPEIETSIGGRLRTNSGVDVMTGVGPDGIVDPHYAGRARLTTEAVTSGEIPTGAQRLRITPAAGTSMFVIKGGGVILLVYGIYKTEERIRAAAGTDQINTVLAEETGSWTGGLLGSALGGAAAGAILCAPTGPVDAVCVIGGFLGGLLFGGAGAAVGSELGHASVNGRPPEGGIIDTITAPVVEPVKKFSDYLEFNIRGLYGIPTGSSF